MKGKVSRIIALDGTFQDFPFTSIHSDDGCLDIARKFADEIKEVTYPWENQIAKRNAYLTLKKVTDMYLVLDADEELEGTFPRGLKAGDYILPIVDEAGIITKQIRLFQHRPGIRYAQTHATIYVKNKIINQIEFNPEARELPGVRIIHNKHLRKPRRQQEDTRYMAKRKENPVPKPQANVTGKVKLFYIGEGHYSGYEVNGDYLEVFQNQFVFLSPEKAKQLLEDFPKEWRKE